MPLIRQLLLSLHRENTDGCVPNYLKPIWDTLDGGLFQCFHVPNAIYEFLPHKHSIQCKDLTDQLTWLAACITYA